ncbi:MAG: LysR family transcriptional regulator [Paucimonas sp.]|nr:LysR family transcriptional regulator [Paucimonas sp.]
MDILSAMKVFVAVVDAGSFAAAAERLQMSRAMASKQVANLEDHLGSRLLNRTTRRLSLTESGRAFHERSAQILADIAEAEEAVGQNAAEPRGVLKVTMPMSYGMHRLGPIIADYVTAYPKVLIARKLGVERGIICASPAYLKRRGKPKTPKDLADHACLGYALSGNADEWRLEHSQGALMQKIAGPIKADSGDMLRLAAISGAGLIFQPLFIVADDLRAGRLVQVLPAYASPELGIYAIYPSRRHLSAKVRTFVDFLISRLPDETAAGAA